MVVSLAKCRHDHLVSSIYADSSTDDPTTLLAEKEPNNVSSTLRDTSSIYSRGVSDLGVNITWRHLVLANLDRISEGSVLLKPPANI